MKLTPCGIGSMGGNYTKKNLSSLERKKLYSKNIYNDLKA